VKKDGWAYSCSLILKLSSVAQLWHQFLFLQHPCSQQFQWPDLRVCGGRDFQRKQGTEERPSVLETARRPLWTCEEQRVEQMECQNEEYTEVMGTFVRVLDLTLGKKASEWMEERKRRNEMV
jgi:hypothetical protein